MKNIIKLLAFFALAAVIGFSFVACGDDDGENPGDNGPPPVVPHQGKDILSLPSMKDQFEGKFLIGNIFNPGDAPKATGINTRYLTRHFNVLTPENALKPSELCGSNSSTYNADKISTAKRMIAAAKADGIEVVGHTLLWHQQIPQWQIDIGTSTNSVTVQSAIDTMKTYIAYVVNEFKGDIYAWDVLNEVFTDSGGDWKTGMRSDNPWFKKIGSDFVYEAYLQARESDPDALLLYNDYNLDLEGKATKVRDMVKAVNDKYAEDNPDETRKLIEGIGMQSHHNTGITKNSIKKTLDLFRPLDVEIHISELDVLGFEKYSDLTSGPGTGANKHTNAKVPTAAMLQTQAVRYGEYMALYVENADIIKRVSLWGVRDDQSWRSGGLPLLFDHNGKSKASYDAFVALGDQTVTTPPEVQPFNITPIKYGNADPNGTKIVITDDVVSVSTTVAREFLGFYYALPSDWNTYSTIEMDYTATVSSSVAKIGVKKSAGDNAIGGENSDKYKDVEDGDHTYTWATTLFSGMTTNPGIYFQINNWDDTDVPQQWTFIATAIRLIP